MVRQYLIDIYQFQTDEQGNFEKTIGMNKIAEFPRPTKEQIKSFKAKHANMYHIIEGMVLDHELRSNKLHIHKAIDDFKNNVNLNQPSNKTLLQRDRFTSSTNTELIVSNIGISSKPKQDKLMINNEYVSNYFNNTSPRAKTDDRIHTIGLGSHIQMTQNMMGIPY